MGSRSSKKKKENHKDTKGNKTTKKEKHDGKDSSKKREKSKSISRKSSDWDNAYQSNVKPIPVRKESLFIEGDGDPGVTGLQNLGNTCYMNAAVQCLSNTAPLTDFFVGSRLWQNDVNEKNPLGTGGKLAVEFVNTIKMIWDGQGKTVSLGTFRKTVCNFAPRFAGSSQQDCHEFLTFLLDGLHEDFNRVENKPYVPNRESDGRPDEVVAAEMWLNHLRRNKSVIVDVFQGQLKSSLTCDQCQYTSTTFDPFMYLSLPFPKQDDTEEMQQQSEINIEMLLDEFVKPEKLVKEEQWYCPKCEMPVDATKKLDLWKVPPVLIIHLKRFKFTSDGKRLEKIKNHVDFPIRFFSFENRLQTAQRNLSNYSLYAIARHYGNEAKGHYTAMALNRGSHTWFEFNDSKCEKVEEETIVDHHAYMLFYQKESLFDEGYRRQSVTKPEAWPHMLDADELDLIAEVPSMSSSEGVVGSASMQV